MIFKSITIDKLNFICDELHNHLSDGGVILLNGTLGSGKTTLVKEFNKYYGDLSSEVTSPTFSVMNQYSKDIFHYDLYLKEPDYIFTSSLYETLNYEGYHFIEWSSSLVKDFLIKSGLVYLNVDITVNSNSREYSIYE